jgi:hypothetical protein
LTLSDDGSVVVENDKINWNEGKDVTKTSESVDKKRKTPESDSFFNWFVDESEASVEVAMEIMNDFCPNVLVYYQGDDEDFESDVEEADE